MKSKYFVIGALVTLAFSLSAFYAFAWKDKITPVISLTPIPTEVPVSSAFPSPADAPTVTPTPPGDGRSDGLSSCPDCTKAHNNNDAVVIPQGPPATGHGK